MAEKEFSEFNKKSNHEIKVIFSHINCCVMWLLYENPSEASYCGKKITKSKLNSQILPETFNKKMLIVTIDRDSRYTKYIELDKEVITYKELFDILYKFYNKTELSLNELQDMENDISGYIKDAIVDIKKKKKIHIIDIMGHLCRFEDVREVYQDVYELILGS